jgi:hypothetical protein
MQQEQRDKWVAALRSGEYTQITGELRRWDAKDSVGHCCLGVYCEVAGIPYDTDAYFKLNDDIANVEDLWQMNDVAGASFTEIADWIEANVAVSA